MKRVLQAWRENMQQEAIQKMLKNFWLFNYLNQSVKANAFLQSSHMCKIYVAFVLLHILFYLSVLVI